MNLNLKIPTITAIELVDSSNQEEYNLKLLGVKALAEKNTSIEANLNNNNLCCEKNTFASIFTENDTFFYSVELFNGMQGLKLREVGLGKYKNGYILRILPIYTVSSEGKVVPCANGLNLFFTNDPYDYVYVSTYSPMSFNELLIQPNSIVTASEKQFIPQCVYFEENSTIGRLDSGIQNISFASLSSIIIENIKSYTKQFILKCSRLDVKKIKTSNIIIDQSQSGEEKAGSIFFDSKSKKLKFFDGSNWQAMSSEESA